ncbi:MAG: 4-hydroxy-tetrahydrodipicolinate synthase [Euryarchaeota archaeon]|nr:4-hydroxy-tetrahydrodipicolinate synthase [Euryarchaeota archaeon]
MARASVSRRRGRRSRVPGFLRGAIPALVTPFTREGGVDEEGLRRNIEFAVRGGSSAVCPCGTTGESATLSHGEHRRVVELSVECSRVPVVAGTGSNSTEEAVELTCHAADAGARAALLITPYYNKPNREGLLRHFREVHRAADIPLLLYNIPGRTGQNVEPALISQLAREGVIAGVKEASGNLVQVSDVIEGSGPDFAVLSGDDVLTVPILSLGGCGVISVASNIVPRLVSGMVAAALRGDYGEARRLHYRLSPLLDVLFLETNPIPVKRAMDLVGLAAGSPRLPLAPLGRENERRLRAALRGMRLL